MNKRLFPNSNVPSLMISTIFSFLFFTLSLSVKSQTGATDAGKQVTCQLTINNQIYNLPANSVGYFQRISGVKTNATIPVEIFYPNGNAGDEVVLSILDGGSLDSGKTVAVVLLNNENKCVFSLRVNNQLGIFRVLVTKGFDQNMVQVSVTSKDLSLAQRSDSTNCPTCCNDKKEECSVCIAKNIDPCTSNESHDVIDLDVSGGTGEIPLQAMRFGNSRAVDGPWQLNFFYGLYDAGVNASGQPQIDIHFPKGWRTHFTKSSTVFNLWVPLPGVGMRLYQYGNTFFLQLENGHRYQFEKVVTAGVAAYVLQGIKDQFQNVYLVTYDIPNRKKKISEPAGRYLEYAFSPLSFIVDPISIKTNDGRSARFIYDTLNDRIRYHVRLRKVLYGDGTVARYDYSQAVLGKPFSLSHAVDPRVDGTATNMKYEYVNSPEVGLLLKELNGKTGEVMTTLDVTGNDKKILHTNGQLQTFNMPDGQQGAINTYTDGVGAVTKYEYYDGGIGFLKSTTDALGRVTTYDALTIYGNPLEITYPDGSKEKWTRDTLDQVLTHTDGLGRVTNYIRDNRHRPTKITYPDGTFETFTYNDFSQVLDHQKQNGCTEHFTYDSRGLKTKFTDCEGNATSYAYDGADRLATLTDARGNATKYQYSERGLMTKMTNADNSFQTYNYDDFGNRTSLKDELGHTWTTTYDEFKRPVTMKDPLNRTTTYSYDLAGGICGCTHDDNKPTKITLPSGKMMTIEYDVEWRKTGETKGAGSADAATTSYEYDLIGNLVRLIDGRGKQWQMQYDIRNRKKSSSDPLGNKTQSTFDFQGNVLSVKRPDNGTTTYTYDAMDRKTKTTDAKGQVSSMEYDSDGNLVKLIDPKSNSYRFEYDALDRKTKMIYPGGTFEQYSYDPVSNFKTFNNRNGDTRTYTYDIRNRETASDWSDATPDVSRNYDASNRMTALTSSVSALTFTYDADNQLLTETQNIAGAGGAKTIAYTYSADGLRSTLTYPLGTVVSYNYTGRNQMLSITENGAPSVASYTYDLAGNRVNKTMKNSTNTVYTYDDANRMLSLDNSIGAATFAKYNYGYDVVNNRKFVQYDNAKGDVYGYDAIDQVTGVKYDVTNPDGVPGVATRTVNYGLDASGNRTTLRDNATSTNYTTNNLNQYTAVNAIIPTYTNNGSLQTFDGWTYTYDAQDRLIKAQKGSTNVDFLYDGRNRCVRRSVNGINAFFYFDKWNLIEEKSQFDVLVARYVHGAMIDELLAKTSTASTVYYHHDVLGSVVQLTNITGDVVEKYTYDIFGAPTFRNSSNTIILASSFGNRFLFTGREYIQDIVLYDYRNRMYSALLGRFLQPDPLRFRAKDFNLYRYVHNNSINFNDPYGLKVVIKEKWKCLGYKSFEECMYAKISGSAAVIGAIVGGFVGASESHVLATLGELGTMSAGLVVIGGTAVGTTLGVLTGARNDCAGLMCCDDGEPEPLSREQLLEEQGRAWAEDWNRAVRDQELRDAFARDF